MKTFKRLLPPVLIAAAVVALDQLVKRLSAEAFSGGKVHTIIPGFFRLVYVENKGAAFSLFEGQRWFFIIVGVIAVGIMLYAIARKMVWGKWGITSLSFLIAGALGNWIDRVSHGFVIDMFDPYGIKFAIFNVADIFITTGGFMFAAWLIFVAFKEEKQKHGNPNA